MKLQKSSENHKKTGLDYFYGLCIIEKGYVTKL